MGEIKVETRNNFLYKARSILEKYRANIAVHKILLKLPISLPKESSATFVLREYLFIT
jgi:hypothetical protein